MRLMCALILISILLSSCAEMKTPRYGNASIYTTPGSVGGVSYSEYKVTPL